MCMVLVIQIIYPQYTDTYYAWAACPLVRLGRRTTKVRKRGIFLSHSTTVICLLWPFWTVEVQPNQQQLVFCTVPPLFREMSLSPIFAPSPLNDFHTKSFFSNFRPFNAVQGIFNWYLETVYRPTYRLSASNVKKWLAIVIGQNLHISASLLFD